jgi:hypothetical protein
MARKPQFSFDGVLNKEFRKFGVLGLWMWLKISVLFYVKNTISWFLEIL